MKNVYQVLKQKECEAELVRQQIAALRQAIPLLADTLLGAPDPSRKPPRPTPEEVGQWKDALRLAAPLLAEEEDDLVANLRARRFEPAAKMKWKPSLALKRITFSPLHHKGQGTNRAR
jgi:hypothetical protein